MNIFITIRLALTALMRNRNRSALTMLGIIIGVAAVILTVAIGIGVRGFVTGQISSLGSNLLIVVPGSVSGGGRVQSGAGGASTLTPDDGLAIVQIPGVASVSPAVVLRAQVVAGGNNWATTVTGVAPTFTFIRNWALASGTFISAADLAARAKTCVLGSVVAAKLFPDGSSPLGKTVFIKNVPFTVIGTLATKGQTGIGQSQDDGIVIPYSSAMGRLTGLTTVNSLLISAVDASESSQVAHSIVALLEQRHRIAPTAVDDFSVTNLQDVAARTSAVATALQYLLIGIAAISLVVGGIGIMNIMLVSVSERTHEIGLRMALGARSRAILEQFLTESIVLSFAGGLVGVVLGEAAASLAAYFIKWSMDVPTYAAAAAVLFSAIVGIFFGYYPALKAARLNPIEALHAE